MSAYMIITAKVHDRPAVMEYAKLAAALIEQSGGRYLLRVPGAELLEGESGDGASILIVEWPDTATARAFWHGDAYAELKAMRAGKADVHALLVEGEIAR